MVGGSGEREGYGLRFQFDGTFVFGDALEEDIDKDVGVGLVPFVSSLAHVKRNGYLTLVGTAGTAGAAGAATCSGLGFGLSTVAVEVSFKSTISVFWTSFSSAVSTFASISAVTTRPYFP
jgi:hypothetical protein